MKLLYLIESTDYARNTPLHFASMYGHVTIVELLVLYEADLIKKNAEGSTALELSCRKHYFGVSKILISGYETINFDDNVDNPLHTAAQEGSFETVQLMLNKNAPINSLNKDMENSLDIAIRKNHRDVVKVLLKDKNWKKLFQAESKKDDTLEQKYLNIKDSAYELIPIDQDNKIKKRVFQF